MLTKKLMSLTLIALLGLGNLSCACAATTAIESPDDATGHEHHAQAETAADSDCMHVECGDDCRQLAATALDRNDVLPLTASNDVDDADVYDVEIAVLPNPGHSTHSTGPPSERPVSVADTPVRRYDCLQQ